MYGREQQRVGNPLARGSKGGAEPSTIYLFFISMSVKSVNFVTPLYTPPPRYKYKEGRKLGLLLHLSSLCMESNT